MERDLVFSPLPPEPVVVSILFLVLLRSTWYRTHVKVDCDLVASLCMDVSWLFGCPGSFLGFGFGKGGSSPCPSPHPRSSTGRSRIGTNRTPILPRLSSDRSCTAEAASSRFFGLSPHEWERDGGRPRETWGGEQWDREGTLPCVWARVGGMAGREATTSPGTDEDLDQLLDRT